MESTPGDLASVQEVPYWTGRRDGRSSVAPFPAVSYFITSTAVDERLTRAGSESGVRVDVPPTIR